MNCLYFKQENENGNKYSNIFKQSSIFKTMVKRAVKQTLRLVGHGVRKISRNVGRGLKGVTRGLKHGLGRIIRRKDRKNIN